MSKNIHSIIKKSYENLLKKLPEDTRQEIEKEIAKEENNRFTNKLFFEFSSQEILNIIEALTLYKQLILSDKYKPLIDNELKNIVDQLNFQNINIYVNDKESLIGKICLLDDDVYKKGIVLGSSPTENFYKIAVCDNNELKIIELPKVLIK